MIRDYVELTKPRLTSLVVFTTWLGYALASPSMRFGWTWVHTIAGTWLAAGGAVALNQYLECPLDALMHRTQRRPLPQKRLSLDQALTFGIVLSLTGLLELAVFVNVLAAFLASLTLITYLFAYTPLKTRTALCTLVGAVPGAIPPMIGWAAVQNHLGFGAWVLFAILFVWQLPHFLAIAWMYRDDYARAGFPMLPVLDPQGGSTARMIILYCTILIPVTLIPVRMGMAGFSYFWGALFLGTAFLACGLWTAKVRTPAMARRLLLVSVIYLPILLTWMVCNRAV